MKASSRIGRKLLPAVAAIIVMLLVSVGASAHVTVDRLLLAGHGTMAVHDAGKAFAADCMADCLTPASSHRIHCHLSLLPTMMDRSGLSLDDDPPVTVMFALPNLAAQNFGTHFAPGSGDPVSALPSFILFGNFRS